MHWHMSWDCNVTSDDADNPNIKCTRKKVKETTFRDHSPQDQVVEAPTSKSHMVITFPLLPEIVVTTNATLSICILHSKILTSIMISGCIALVWLDACLLSSGYDPRWYRATQASSICGFCGGNGLHRQHISWDCNVTSDDTDNPNIKCTRKEVKETTFRDHSPQDQVVETPTSKSQMIDNVTL